jgi:hypothetical protein
VPTDPAPPVRRDLASVLRREARRYPIVTVTGPRQSGKTTLCRRVFRGKPYVGFERLDTRERARTDPRGLLAEHRSGAVFDEVQHVPDLLGYLQAEVDERPEPGRFVLTGSQHFGLSAAISQSLAGRTAMLHLLPPSLGELRRFGNPPQGLLATLVAGAYPRIHDRGIAPSRWLADYLATYVQRDVRQVLAVGDLNAFSAFLHVAAGRTAQEVNLSGIAADVGVSYNTVRSWISALEASYLVFLVPAWHRSARRRWVKAAKMHWFDSGLVCHLVGIEDEAHLAAHPLRGPIFESFVASEIWKAHAHRGVTPRLVHFRETRGAEVDLGVELGREVTLVECKSGATVHDSSFAGLRTVRADLAMTGAYDRIDAVVVYGGEESQRRSDAVAVPWGALPRRDWTS